MLSNKSKVMLLLAAAFSAGLLAACRKTNDVVTDPGTNTPDPIATYLNLPANPFNYANPALPAYLQAPPVAAQLNTPGNNPVTDWGATLGRVLFYDKNLSINNTIACASCHQQNLGFSDPLVLSKGFAGGNTGRHSMTLINAAYYQNGRFFWDQRAATLEAQTLMPIQDHVEMGMTLDSLVKKLRTRPYYAPLFTKVFGDGNISSERISLALSQFVRSIVSYQSKYDIGRAQVNPGPPPPGGGAPPLPDFPNFTAQENRGKQLFFNSGCAACHFGPETFTAPAARNNGLDLNTTADQGFGTVTGTPNNNGQFKSGTLRNIELTAPYMHDGRFATLEQVVEHYSTGVKNHPNLSAPLRQPDGTVRLLNLNAADKAALVAFMRTLTDNAVSTDVKYSNPFK